MARHLPQLLICICLAVTLVAGIVLVAANVRPAEVEPLLAPQAAGRSYPVTVVRVIDGDTPVVDIDLGLKVWLRGESLRLAEIDAPELNTSAGKEARDYAVEWIRQGAPLTFHPYGRDGRDKYGRLCGWLRSGDRDLGRDLLDTHHAVPYQER